MWQKEDSVAQETQTAAHLHLHAVQRDVQIEVIKCEVGSVGTDRHGPVEGGGGEPAGVVAVDAQQRPGMHRAVELPVGELRQHSAFLEYGGLGLSADALPHPRDQTARDEAGAIQKADDDPHNVGRQGLAP